MIKTMINPQEDLLKQPNTSIGRLKLEYFFPFFFFFNMINFFSLILCTKNAYSLLCTDTYYHTVYTKTVGI